MRRAWKVMRDGSDLHGGERFGLEEEEAGIEMEMEARWGRMKGVLEIEARARR